MFYRFFWIVLLVFSLPVQTQTQNPRLNGGWVSDEIGYLRDSGALSEINEMISELEKDTSVEIAIVTKLTIGEMNPKEYANTLFNEWGIGKKGKDNGILILHVFDQRRIEIETGYGLEGVVPDILCKRILEKFIVPNFKSNQFSMGMTLGSFAIINSIKNPNASMEQKLSIDEFQFNFADLPASHYQDKIKTITEENFFDQNGIFARHITSPTNSIKEFFYFWLGILVMSISVFLGVILALLRFGNKTLYNFYNYFGRTLAWLSGIVATGYMLVSEIAESDTSYSLLNLLPIGIGLFFVNGWIQKKLRNNPRKCPTCKSKMIKLNEKQDNKHLSKGEGIEEKIKSVDYDIWECNNCSKITKEKYTGDSPASTCPKCHFNTFQNIRVTVIRSATYESDGEELHEYECANCKHAESKYVTIPKKVKSSSSGSSSSGGGGSSWSSGGSSGSWGGGSSGGGGSGSSY